MNLPMKQKRFTDKDNRLTVAKGVGRGRDKLGVWGWQMQTIIYRMDKQQGPTVYSTGNYIQYPVTSHNGK